MAKRKREWKNLAEPEQEEFTNSNGIVMTLKALPPMDITRIRSSVKYPDPPTYETTTVSGDVEVFPHDATTVVTEEEKKALADYLQETGRCDDEVTLRLLNYVIMEAVTIKMVGKDIEHWKKRQKLIGMDVSDDPDELELQYKQSKVIGCKEDVQNILRIVMALTGVPEEDIALAEESFPDNVESSSQSEGRSEA